MKVKFILLILLASASVHARSGNIKILNYTITADYDRRATQLHVEARTEFLKDDSTVVCTFLLSPDAMIKSIKDADQSLIPYHISGNDTLSVSMTGKSGKADKLTLIFTYSLPLDSFMVDKGMLLLKQAYRWYPCQVGDIFNSLLKITVPDNLITVSNGTCGKKFTSGHSTTYFWKTRYERDLALIIFPPDSMEYRKVMTSGTRINFYLVPGLKDRQKIISLVTNSSTFYDKLLGKYQYPDFTVLEIPATWFLGQGLHTLLLFTSKVMEYIPDPGEWVPHEVAHQWMGGIVLPDEHARGRWFVEESITEYLKAMFIEKSFGPDSLKHLMKEFYLANYQQNVKKGKGVAIRDVVSVNNSIEEAQSIYAKGPIFLHQLRICMGNKNWNALIKDIFHDYRNRLFTLDDFENYLAKYDPEGECLRSFNTLLLLKDIPEGFSFLQ